MTTWRDGSSANRTAAELELADAAALHASQHAPGGTDDLTWLTGRPLARSKPVTRNVIVTDFSTWQNVGGVSINFADTADSVFGTAAKSTTQGTGAGMLIKKVALPAANLTGRKILVWVKLDSRTGLTGGGGWQIYAGDTNLTNFKTWELNTGLAENLQYIQVGSWWAIVLDWTNSTSTVGSPNRAAVTDWQMRVVDNNTGIPVTVHFGGIASIPEPATTYPNGVLTFTFDDGYDTQFSVARPYLDKYGYSASAYVICDAIDTAGNMTSANLRDLEANNGWEVGVHAYTTATHATNYDALTAAALDADLQSSKYWLQRRGLSGYQHGATPHGAWNKTAYDVMRRHLATVRTTFGTAMGESWPPADPLRLRCRPFDQTSLIATAKAWVDVAVASQQWLIVLVHGIVASPTGSDVSVANFQAFVDYVNSKGIAVRTMSQVMEGAVA